MNWIHFFQMTSPWLVLFAAASLALLIGAFAKKGSRRVIPIISTVGLVTAFLLSWRLWLEGGGGVSGMLSFDRFSFFGWMLVLLVGIFTVLVSHHSVRERRFALPEYYALLLLSMIGMGCLISGSDLVTIFLGLEIMSIGVYVLAGFFRRRLEGNEAALKYFLNGAFASAFLLMGIAFLFGSVGSTDLAVLADRAGTVVAGEMKFFFLFGVAMVVIGFCFKVAAVPFHAWAPDAYDGAPTPITSFMATAVKAAAFFAFVRLGAIFFPVMGEGWITVVTAIAVATMLVGNLAAIAQDNIKRMLAYSSIAHAGYLFVAFPSIGVDTARAVQSVGFYLIAYVMMTVGAFAVIIVAQGGHESADISRLAGLGKRRPWLAAMLTLFLISLTGFPPTVGFFAKYYLFWGAVKSGYVWLVVVGLLNSAISAYYYLRPVVVIYFHPPREGEEEIEPAAPPIVAVVAITALAVILFGCFPSNLLSIVEHSIF